MLPEIPSSTSDVTLRITYSPERQRDPKFWEWDALLASNGVLAVSLLQQDTAEQIESISPELSARELAELLYPNNLLDPISPHPRDQPLYRVRVIPYILGKRLAEFDPAREFFHIEFFPGTKPPRAELWSRLAWDQSLTRRLRISAYANEHDPTQIFQQRYAVLVKRIASFVCSVTPTPASKAEQAAENFIRTTTYDEFLTLLKPPADFLNEIQRVRAMIDDLTTTFPNLPHGPVT